MKMDDSGNILIKKVCRCNVFAKSHKKIGANSTGSDSVSSEGNSAISSDLLKSNGKVESEKAIKLFDMKKFTGNMERELRNSYPDRQKLEKQCITVLAFVKDAAEILELPCYILVINIVAIDLLKSRIPSGSDIRSAGLSSSSGRYALSSSAVFDDEDEDDTKWDDVYSSSKTEEDYSLSKPDSSSGGSSGSQGIYHNNNHNSKKALLHAPVSSSSIHHFLHLPSTKLPPKLPPRDFPRKKLLRPEPLPDYTDDEQNHANENDRDDRDENSNQQKSGIHFRSKSSSGSKQPQKNGRLNRANFPRLGFDR